MRGGRSKHGAGPDGGPDGGADGGASKTATASKLGRRASFSMRTNCETTHRRSHRHDLSRERRFLARGRRRVTPVNFPVAEASQASDP